MQGRQEGILSVYLVERCVLDLSGDTRTQVFEELARRVSRELRGISPRQIVSALEAREKTLSTRVSPDVAIPHAVLPVAGTRIVVGRRRTGVSWDDGESSPVRLVALIVGPRSEHLHALALVAERLNLPERVRAVLDAPDAESAHAALLQPMLPGEVADPGRERTSRACVRSGLALARATGADAIVLHADSVGHYDLLETGTAAPRVLFVAGDPTRIPESLRSAGHVLHLPFTGHDRGGRVDVALLYAVSQGTLHPSDRVVSVCGVPGTGILDSIRFTDLAREYREFLALRETILPKDLEQQVLLRVLQVAARIAEEGREGDAVGTIFVVGDYPRVRRRCRQMIINPFHGCGDNGRNILDPGLEETIKEFARLDGAFIVRGDGRIMSAGTFLRTEATVEDLPKGLGARHGAAAAITVDTSALSVVVSQSTRRVRLFKNGRQVLAFQP